MSFDLIDGLTAEGPDHSLSVDNFLGLLTILDDFATAASTLQEQQLHKRRRAEPLSSSKYVNKLGCKSVVVDTNWHLVAHRSLPEARKPLTYSLCFTRICCRGCNYKWWTNLKVYLMTS